MMSNYSKDYYSKNKEAFKASSKKYYQSHKEELNERQLKRYHKHKHTDKAIKSRMFTAAKQRAKLYGLSFSISIDDIIIPEICPVFLTEFKVSEGKASLTSPSLDRIDSSQGYVPGNVQVLSWRANRAKSNMTCDEVERLLSTMKP